MPIYEYACGSCGTVVEVLQRVGDRPLRKCRECSGRLSKLVSRTSFQLKGSGWFAHGYGGDGPGDPKQQKGAADAKGTGDSAKKKKKKKKSEAGGSSEPN